MRSNTPSPLGEFRWPYCGDRRPFSLAAATDAGYRSRKIGRRLAANALACFARRLNLEFAR